MLGRRLFAWPVVAVLSVVLFGASNVWAQEAAPAPAAGTTPLPAVEVTTTEAKPKAKSKTKSQKSAAKPVPVQAAAPQPSVPKASDGGSTAPGAVNGYVVKEGTVGTKTNTPLQEVPQAISTVTRQQLEERKPQNLVDAIGYVPGVRVGVSGYDPRFDSFNIRGFDATYSGIYRDGLRQLGGSFGQFKTEPYGLDSITILKGPSSALYGAGNAGGIVDMYTKRPTETPFNELELIVGSYDRVQGNFDLSGPVAPGSSVLYRLTGVVRDSDTEALGVPDDRVYLAPAFTFKVDDDTKLTVFGEFMDAATGANMAWLNDYSGDHVRRTNIWSGDPAFNKFNQMQERVGYELEHRLSNSVTFRQKARYAHLFETADYIDIYDFEDQNAPHEYARVGGFIDSAVDTANLDNQLEARFSTGIARHTVLAGVESSYITYWEQSAYTEDGWPPLIDFNYGQQHIERPPVNTWLDQSLFSVATYLQDQIKIDQWVVTLSGRRDWAHTETTETTDKTTHVKQGDEAWSGRAGLSYLFDFGLAPYVAYGTSFIPNAGVDLGDGTPFEPTTSKSKEVGFKYAVPGANATLNAALFDIEQKGGLFYDPKSDHSVQRGKLRSRGFEIEGATTLDNGLSLLASYTFLNMRIVEGEDGTNGNEVSSTPRHMFSVWSYYAPTYGVLKGFGFGGGVRYLGSSFGDDENTFKNEAHALFDAAAHYDLAGISQAFAGTRLQINATNIFDKQDDVCSSNYCYLDQGRTVQASVRYRW